MRKSLVLVVVALVLGGACAPADGPDTTAATEPFPSTTPLPPSTVPTTAVPTTSTAPATTTTTVPVTNDSASTTTSRPTPTTAPQAAPATVVTRIDTTELVVALTFDCGSDRGYAQGILDILATHGIKASFGMTGVWAQSNPDLVLRMAEEGHALINHTYDHPHMETLGTEERLHQLESAESIIREITGASTRPFFRPPYGSYNNQVLIDVGSAGYRYSVMWTVDCLGWKGLPPSGVFDRCRNALQPGAILLMHVGAASTDYAALEDIITAIDQGGYRYATIPELLP